MARRARPARTHSANVFTRDARPPLGTSGGRPRVEVSADRTLALRDQERQLDAIRAEWADLDRPRVVPLNLAQLAALARTKAEEWQALLRKHAPIARQMVRKLVEGRNLFTPDRERRRYTFQMTGTLTN